MSRRVKRMKSEELRQKERHDDRCEARHPNWHGVRCERSKTDHPIHLSEERNFEWLDVRFDS